MSAKYFKVKDGVLTDKVDAVAVTCYSGGIMFTGNHVNFGIFVGFDAMIDKYNDWHYQGRPWYSFGLGYKFKKD